MQIDIGAYIADLLFQNNSVNIPGLGGFTTRYKTASIDHVQGKIAPPAKEIGFNKNLVLDDGILVNYIKDKHQLSFEDAQTALEDYVKGVKAAIERREIVVFPKVGRLYKDYEQNLQFLADNTNFNVDSFGLPTVQFYPIAQGPEKVAATVGATSQRTATKAQPIAPGESFSDKLAEWFQQNIAYIGAVSVVVVGFVLFLMWKKNDPQPAVPEVPSSRVNVSPVEEPEEDDLVVDPNVEEQNTDLIEDETGTTDEDNTEEASEPLDTEGATVAPNQKFCIIGIGVFGNEDNVRKLVQKIYEEGFEPYTEKSGNLTRVGIQMPYEDEDEIDIALNTVRKKFEKKAKILKK